MLRRCFVGHLCSKAGLGWASCRGETRVVGIFIDTGREIETSMDVVRARGYRNADYLAWGN